MEVFIIVVLLVIVKRMFTNIKDTDEKEKERLYPGYLIGKEK